MHKYLKNLVIMAFLLTPIPAGAEQVPQYDAKMLRLAEILGSLHYLRNLCGQKTPLWRDKMEELIKAENPAPTRRARLYAAFNDAYRAFSDNYHTCTKAAVDADRRYIKEGTALSHELLNRYGN
ncbi:TIGR02301 family protein [Bartonella sp. W8098]|uniref:TIGR02301 family protein n=1 Tax=Bartonella TaxID=773 RepID=UPI0018DBE05C|nr:MULTISPECIES: TIGR02301 family protein [Bartonella]MBH9987810.1 TIGR02301 family protein [Bartonella apis]MBI0172113.1 TIGR02301 family protein [Bartonella sp. W8151]